MHTCLAAIALTRTTGAQLDRLRLSTAGPTQTPAPTHPSSWALVARFESLFVMALVKQNLSVGWYVADCPWRTRRLRMNHLDFFLGVFAALSFVNRPGSSCSDAEDAEHKNELGWAKMTTFAQLV